MPTDPLGTAPTTATAQFLALLRDVFGKAFVFVRGYGGAKAGEHHGIDLAAAPGTPIRAISGGVVTFADYAGNTISGNGAVKAAPGWTYGGGNVVEISTGGVRQDYAHMSKIAVASGQRVNPGDIIGYVGATGLATGAHLHFAVWNESARSFVDPLPYLVMAQAKAFGDLSFWNGVVTFPEGHTLTAADVDSIIAKLDAIHAFQAQNLPPILQQLAENTARDTVRGILMQHVGEKWTPELAQSLQTQFFGAAKAAGTNPLTDIANMLGKLFDPGVWIRILALILGALLMLYGGANVLRATA